MPPKVDPLVKMRAIKAYADNGTISEVSARFKMNPKTLRAAIQEYSTTGAIEAPKPKGGRMQKIHQVPDEFLRNLIKEHPTIYLKELGWRLQNELGLGLHLSTISRHLKKRQKITQKQYQKEVGQYSPEQLVFCDESAVTEQSTRRWWAWSSIERWSLLPLLSIQGFIAVEAVQGAYNKAAFEDWIYNCALPAMNPYPQPNSVLILDNCPIHNEDCLRAMCIERGVRLLMLPPYSPDFNPIESAFGLIKHYLQVHFEGSLQEDLPAAMLEAAQNAITPAIAEKIYKGCHIYYVDDQAIANAESNWDSLTAQP